MKFTSKKDKSKFIFIPVAGYAWGSEVYGSGTVGRVWSNMLCAEVDCGLSIYFYLEDISLGGDVYFRNNGFSVRGVIG